MKRQGILHPGLAAAVASLGHGDLLVVADAGLPVPPGVARIDLAVAAGVPGFFPVLEAVLGEVRAEAAVAAAEAAPDLVAALGARLGAVPLERVPHAEFKALTARARAVVRTGEFTPYCNVILRAGVVF